VQRFHQATAPACSPWSRSPRLEAKRWPSRSTVAFGALVDDERIVMSWAYRQQAKRDGGSGPNCGTASGRSSGPPRRPRQMPPTSHESGTVASTVTAIACPIAKQQDRPPRSRLLRGVPGQQHGEARRGARSPAAAPDCLLVLREPELRKQVRDIGDSRDRAASSASGRPLLYA
jgi:hypothetical protein